MSLLFHKLIVCTVFNTAAAIHNRDFIGVFDCGKSMCDNKGGAVFGEIFYRFLNFAFSDGVKGACGLVKNNNARISDDRPGY